MRRVVSVIEASWVAVAIVVAWWLITAGGDHLFFPPLREILVSFNDNWLFERWGPDVLPSLRRFFAGYLIGVVLGVGLGTLIGLSARVQAAARWNVMFLIAMPPVALIPFTIIVFGIDDLQKIVLIAVGVTSIVLFNTIEGVAGVERELREMARVYHLPWGTQLMRVTLPAAAPQIVAGMRSSLSVALLLVVTSELVAATNGIGYRILTAQRTFAFTEMWSGMVLLAVLGYICNTLFEIAERRVLFWQYQRLPA